MNTKTYSIRLDIEVANQLYKVPKHKELVKQSIFEIISESKIIFKKCKSCKMKFQPQCFAGELCLNCNAIEKQDNTITFSDEIIKELHKKKELHKQRRMSNDNLKSVKAYCIEDLGISLSTLQKRFRKLKLSI